MQVITQMDSIYTTIQQCRICKEDNMQDVISIGDQAITSRFPIKGDFTTPVTPIDLCLCKNCGLLQLRQCVKSNQLYEFQYGYRSGISNTMKEHLKQYNQEILNLVSIQPGETIVDIGSNDSTMLQYYSNSYKRIGIDPTGKQFREFYKDVELIEDYFTRDTFHSVYGTDLRCKIVSSISMFYDLPDPVQFAQDIHDILHDDGIWTCEQSYVISMLKQNSFDTICHEHLEYYGLHQIAKIAEMANMKILDVKFNDCNGGSFRIYFCKKTCTRYTPNQDHIDRILEEERNYGLFDETTYTDFMKRCDAEVHKLCDFIDIVNSNNQSMWIYGASTKGNCLLQYGDITDKTIQYAVERNPEKIGKMTVTGIEIISEETMRQNPPEYLLVLPWHFRDEIIEREKVFLENGGKLVFPLPHLEIYSAKPKVLITGCDGFIADYFIDEFSSKYDLYGISRNSVPRKNIVKYFTDLNFHSYLETIITTLNPYAIIHLAGISSSIKAFENPIEAITANGMNTVHICDIIHRNHLSTKLFNASSSEIFKGYKNYTVNEHDINHPYHNHPYSIGKILGHNTVDFYRNTYGLPFSNGVLFTIESNKKRGNFLLNKVVKHAKGWASNTPPLILGSLDSYRNILHAKDAVCAIDTIIQNDDGTGNSSYSICHKDGSIRIKDLVLSIYRLCGIALEVMTDGNYYKKDTKELVLQIQYNHNGLDNEVIDICGFPSRLNSLGWTCNFTIDEILMDILSG